MISRTAHAHAASVSLMRTTAAMTGQELVTATLLSIQLALVGFFRCHGLTTLRRACSVTLSVFPPPRTRNRPPEPVPVHAKLLGSGARARQGKVIWLENHAVHKNAVV